MRADQDEIFGIAEQDFWTECIKPFAPTYPKGRAGRTWNRRNCWNVDSIEGPTPLTDAMLNHMGAGINEAVLSCPKCNLMGMTCQENAGGE